MSDDDTARIQGDPGEANRGVGPEMVGEASPRPRQRSLDPAAGGSGAGSARTPRSNGLYEAEEARVLRDQGPPQND